MRAISATIRYLLSRQESSFPIKLIAHTKIYLRSTEFESVHIAWKANGLPLTYNRLYYFFIKLIRANIIIINILLSSERK